MEWEADRRGTCLKITLTYRMDICYPTIVTAALFAVIFILDIRNNEYKTLFLHFLFSIISILLITYLCENGLKLIAWTLLISPFILIFIASSLDPAIQELLPSIPVSRPTRKCAPGCPKPCCPKPKPKPSPTPSGTCGPNGNSPRCINVDSLPSV